MRTLHRLSAVVLVIFVVAHIGNHIAAAFGVEAHRTVNAFLRRIYRHPIGEPTLIGLIALQIGTGVNLFIASARRNDGSGVQSLAELLSLLAFLAFIFVHLAAVAVVRYFEQEQTDFYWISELMSRKTPLQPYIVAFHFLGAAAVSFHAGLGLKYMFKSFGLTRTGHALMIAIILFGVAGGAISVAAYAGLFSSVI